MELKTVLQIADQLIDRIKTLHDLGYVHGDIKPGNMAMGTGDSSRTLHLLDFGSSKVFKENHVHLPERCGNEMVGTAEFASLNNHTSLELSRRDDLESMAYTLIYLLKGSLPWQDSADVYYDCFRFKMYCKKMAIPPSNLCQGIEPELCEFLSYARGRKGYTKAEFDVKGKNPTEYIVKKNRRPKWKTNTPSLMNMTRKENNAALTKLAQEQSQQEQVFYSLLRVR